MKSFSALLLLGLLSLLTSMEAGTGRNRGRRWKTKTTPNPTMPWTTTPSPTTSNPTPEPPTTPWTTTPSPTTPSPTFGWETTTTTKHWKNNQNGGKSGKSKSKSKSSGWNNGNNGGDGGKSKPKSSSGWKNNNNNHNGHGKGSKSSSGAWKKSSSGGQWKKSSDETWYKPPPPQPAMCPVGMAHIWFGDIHGIPAGFQICDGSNGTPDLRDRFVMGAGSQFPFGTNGGASSVSLAASQLAPHTHGAGSLMANPDGSHLHHLSTSINEGGHSHGFHLEAAAAGNHKHKIDLQTGSDGDHDHTFDAYLPVDYNSDDEKFGVPVDKVDKDESYAQTVSSDPGHTHSVYGYTQMAGSHTHSISGSIGGSGDGKHFHHIDADTGSSGTHSHAVSGATGSTGEGAPIPIMNPYHSLYFICCVGKQHKANYY